jgi:hypothetical protein
MERDISATSSNQEITGPKSGLSIISQLSVSQNVERTTVFTRRNSTPPVIAWYQPVLVGVPSCAACFFCGGVRDGFLGRG